MSVYLYRAPAGIPGSITRVDQTNVEPGYLASSGAPTAFGQPVKIVSGKFALMGASSVAADFYGVVTRIVPSIGGAGETLADGAPQANQFAGIAVRGYVNVLCGVGTPARGGVVYVRVVDGGVGKPVGQFEATADGVNNVALTGVTWASDGLDADKNAEIRIAR